jgi:hypothetical protein
MDRRDFTLGGVSLLGAALSQASAQPKSQTPLAGCAVMDMDGLKAAQSSAETAKKYWGNT